MMRLWSWLGLLLILCAPVATAAKKAEADYAGDDGGYLVYSVGTIRIGMHFDFPYRRVATADGGVVDDWKGHIEPTVGGAFTLKVKNPDFTGVETGHVIVRRLPPGSYAIDNFAFAGQSPGGGGIGWSSAKPFRIAFTIKPGEATYIGSFMRSPSFGTPLAETLGAAGFFVISDQSARDLPIALTKRPALPQVMPQVTDVAPFGSAALQNRIPE